MAIGHLNWDQLLCHAKSLSEHGGLSVPTNATRIEDLPISGPEEILRITKAIANTNGAILNSSGGTTGKPKLAYTPFHQAMGRLLQQWKPLGPGSVLLNLFNPGRLWGAHYFIQTLCEKSKAISVPAGPFTPEEVSAWIETFDEIGINALAGAPTGLADFAQGLMDAKGKLAINTIIWMAEPWTESKFKAVRSAFPNAGFWCDYGSVETNSIAVNGPECDRDTYHLLPDQLIEPNDHGALLTRIGDGWTVPLIRYRLGDKIEKSHCRCGRSDALIIEGRADDSVSLLSALISTGQVIRLAEQVPGVEEVQLLLTRSKKETAIREASVFTITFTGAAEPQQVSKQILNGIHNLASVVHQYPNSFLVKRVQKLQRVTRTNKVPAVIWRE
ncbi:AMP-binding protein [Microbulbifer sp. THAF38]|uniref:AMP-binding protein n=1 Tax=Microbulbifer sp. THAF38 TaxID=2587856 RepID=UPI0012693BA5|nr:AMP-binding protein [Microbulbifer sp. THAF38]QFT54827.1 AMP-binding enzyme [Microbulbifer sp. THAF38]